MLSATPNATNETRKVGEQSGGDGAVPFQAEIGASARSPL
jgi:hypothetical protein